MAVAITLSANTTMAQSAVNFADLTTLSHAPEGTAKTTSTLQRISGIHVSVFDGALFTASDSGRLTYTGIRGSDLFGGVLDFDDFTIIHLNSTTMIWENVQRQMQAFNGMNQKLNNNAQAWNAGTSMWENDELYSYTYDVNNDKAQDLQQTWNVGTSTYENYSRTSYLYDGAHHVIQSTVQNWNTGTSSWDNSYKTTYTYTGNQLDLTVGQYWNGSTWENSAKNIYQYTGGNLTSDIYQYYSVSTFVNSARNLYTYNSGNARETQISQNWDGSAWENTSRTSYTHNSFNSPITQEIMSWNTGSSSWEYTIGSQRARISYETYTNSVKQLAASTGALAAYPIPAQNTLHISLKNDKAMDAAIAVYDIHGRVVMEWNEHIATNYTKAIPVGNLPAGNYTIGLRTADAMETCRIVVAR